MQSTENCVVSELGGDGYIFNADTVTCIIFANFDCLLISESLTATLPMSRMQMELHNSLRGQGRGEQSPIPDDQEPPMCLTGISHIWDLLQQIPLANDVY